VREAVLRATLDLLDERGFDGMELPEIARRAGVHPTTVYRRWGTKPRLVGEALLDRARPLRPTPDTGALESDLEQLLVDGGRVLHTPAVRALFAVLLDADPKRSSEVIEARDRFWAAHMDEARRIVDRAAQRSELSPDADPEALVELVIGPAILRGLLMGRELGPAEARRIVRRALDALPRPTSAR
jgi:AcrR family transcriptional regulator